MSQKTFVNHQGRSARTRFDLKPVTAAQANSQSRRKPTGTTINAEKNNSAARRKFTLAGVILVTAGLVTLFIMLWSAKNVSEGSQVLQSEAKVAEPPAVQAPMPDVAAEDAASKKAAEQILTELKDFQAATQNSMSFEEYDGMLTRLNTNLNSTLPAFGQHSSDSDSFRQEVAAAVREYDAARNWWKTCNKNSQVLNENDRTERLQADWNQAQTHLDNAQKYYSALKTASD